jgi:hypothetical protein
MTREVAKPMHTTSTLRRLVLGLGTSALLAAAFAGPALATDTVTQSITAGVLSASVANLTLPSVPYQNGAHVVMATMALTVDDSTNSNAGWGVTIQESGFVYTDGAGTPNAANDIPATNFAVTSAADPLTLAGHPASNVAATGPEVATTFVAGTLSSPRRTIEATAGYGQGTYSQALGVTLTIPAMSPVGTYTGLLVVTFVAAP